MKIEWASYLKNDSESDWITTNQVHKEAWEEELTQKRPQLPQEDLVIMAGNVTIQQKKMVLEYLLVNQSDHAIKDIEMGISLAVFGKDYFSGRIKTKENWYDELSPNQARLDFIDFGNDRFDDQILTPKDYKLTVHFCKEIEYMKDKEMEQKI